MVVGTYKNGVAIMVTYQAVKAGTGKTVQMDVYDESQALDAGKSGVMTEIGSTGRYYKSFTPDAEGEWIVMMKDGTGKGEVVKAFAVCGQDLDSVGDNVDAIKVKTDTIPADPAETSDITGAHATTDALITTVDAVVDAIEGKVDVVDTVVDTIDGKVDAIGGIVDTMESDIRGSDGDTLKTLSDEIDAVGSPAMVG